jgi:hypothetical protein
MPCRLKVDACAGGASPRRRQGRAAQTYARWLAPYPTDKDLKKAEPKIQANLCLRTAHPMTRRDCCIAHLGALDHVSRDYYP